MNTAVDALLHRLDNVAESGEFLVFVELAEYIGIACIQGYSSPFFPDAVGLDSNECERARRALITFVADNPDSPSLASAFWCLGRLCDPSLKGYFDEQLAGCLKRGGEAEVESIGNLLEALSSLDALKSSGAAVFDDRQMLHDARAYVSSMSVSA